MTPTGEWIPEKAAATLPLDTEKLRQLATISAQAKLESIATLLSDSEQKTLAAAMQASREQWQQVAEPLTDAELVDLIKTLAIAEMHLPNCNFGAKSVVIHINRLLKQRGKSLDKTDLLWLKQHSTNRFLPNGPIL
jgi:hypothetical protein